MNVETEEKKLLNSHLWVFSAKGLSSPRDSSLVGLPKGFVFSLKGLAGAMSSLLGTTGLELTGTVLGEARGLTDSW